MVVILIGEDDGGGNGDAGSDFVNINIYKEMRSKWPRMTRQVFKMWMTKDNAPGI